jgi:multiple sugar transport system ATP-binding protein
MATIEFKNVVKKFGQVVAVNDLSFKVEDKEFMILLGPSGCGKSTVLRLIAGLEKPTEGEIYIDDQLVNDVPPWERNVAMVFQSYALYPHMTVRENLSFPLRIKKLPKNEIEERVREAAKLLGIEELLDRRPRELSGGEMQRVALGRAIVRKPRCFLMDEPLSNLDAKLRVYMRAELKKLQRELGITTVYVTHDQVEAMTMGHRTLILKDGILQQVGTSEDIYRRPANEFVAGFIGSPPMNLITCRFNRERGVLFTDSFSYKLPNDIAKKLMKTKNQEFTFGVRPEAISLSHSKKPNSVKVELLVEEPIGKELILTLKAGESLFKAIAPPTFEVKEGESLYLSFDPDDIHIFDKSTQMAVL